MLFRKYVCKKFNLRATDTASNSFVLLKTNYSEIPNNSHYLYF